MVHFVGAPNGFAITAGCIAEYLKPLVDKNIVNKEICQSIGKYAQTYSKSYVQYAHIPQQEEADTDNCIKDEEGIIALKPRVMVLAVVVFMQAPQETVHNVFMGEPRHKFNHEECNNEDKDIHPHTR